MITQALAHITQCGQLDYLVTAIEEMLMFLPNREYHREGVVIRLVEKLPADADDQISVLLGAFLDLTPINYGACRKKQWWEIIRRVMRNDERVARCYLRGFPVVISEYQLKALQEELHMQLDLDFDTIDTLLFERNFWVDYAWMFMAGTETQ